MLHDIGDEKRVFIWFVTRNPLAVAKSFVYVHGVRFSLSQRANRRPTTILLGVPRTQMVTEIVSTWGQTSSRACILRC
jgi:hypothetical protein